MTEEKIVPNFNENVYPCEECDYFRSYVQNYGSPCKIQCFECTKQGVMIKRKDGSGDKGIRLLLIYCPYQDEYDC